MGRVAEQSQSFCDSPKRPIAPALGSRLSQNVPGRNQRCEYGIGRLGRPGHPNIKACSRTARVGGAAQSGQSISTETAAAESPALCSNDRVTALSTTRASCPQGAGEDGRGDKNAATTRPPKTRRCSALPPIISSEGIKWKRHDGP
jgi:hypothetical protein